MTPPRLIGSRPAAGATELDATALSTPIRYTEALGRRATAGIVLHFDAPLYLPSDGNSLPDSFAVIVALREVGGPWLNWDHWIQDSSIVIYRGAASQVSLKAGRSYQVSVVGAADPTGNRPPPVRLEFSTLPEGPRIAASRPADGALRALAPLLSEPANFPRVISDGAWQGIDLRLDRPIGLVYPTQGTVNPPLPPVPQLGSVVLRRSSDGYDLEWNYWVHEDRIGVFRTSASQPALQPGTAYEVLALHVTDEGGHTADTLALRFRTATLEEMDGDSARPNLAETQPAPLDTDVESLNRVLDAPVDPESGAAMRWPDAFEGGLSARFSQPLGAVEFRGFYDRRNGEWIDDWAFALTPERDRIRVFRSHEVQPMLRPGGEYRVVLTGVRTGLGRASRDLTFDVSVPGRWVAPAGSGGLVTSTWPVDGSQVPADVVSQIDLAFTGSISSWGKIRVISPNSSADWRAEAHDQVLSLTPASARDSLRSGRTYVVQIPDVTLRYPLRIWAGFVEKTLRRSVTLVFATAGTPEAQALRLFRSWPALGDTLPAETRLDTVRIWLNRPLNDESLALYGPDRQPLHWEQIQSGLSVTFVRPLLSGETVGGWYEIDAVEDGGERPLTHFVIKTTADTEPPDTEPPDTEPPDTEPPDTEPPDIEPPEPPPTTTAASFTLDLDPFDGDQGSRRASVAPGGLLDVQLLAEDLPEILGWVARFEIPSSLELIPGSVRSGSFLPGQIVNVRDLGPGLFEVEGLWGGRGGGRAGDGELALLTVRAAALTRPQVIRLNGIWLNRVDGGQESFGDSVGLQVQPAASVAASRPTFDTDAQPGDQGQLFAERLRPGEVFDVEVHVPEGPAARAWGGVFEFDADSLEFVDFTPGSYIPDAAMLVDLGPGWASVGLAALGVGVGDLGTGGHAGTAHFRALTPGLSTLRLASSQVHGADGVTLSHAGSARVVLSQGESILSVDLDPAPGDQRQRELLAYEPGDEIVIQLYLRNGPDLSGWGATVHYDPARLDYVDGSFLPGDLLPDAVPVVDVDEGTIMVGAAVLGAAAGLQGDGLLGSLTLKAKGSDSDVATEVTLDDIGLRLPTAPVVWDIAARGARLWQKEPVRVTLDLNPAPGDQQIDQLPLVHSGSRVRVQLYLHGAPAVRGWRASIAYDPSHVEYVPGSFVASDLIPNLVPFSTLLDSSVLQIGGGVLGLADGVEGNGYLGIAEFRVLEGFPGLTFLALQDVAMLRSTGSYFDVSTDAIVALVSGDWALTAVVETTGPLPETTTLHPAYPNPANGAVVIPFDVASSGNVEVSVYALTGARVTTLVASDLPPGHYRTTWKVDDDGHLVASGVYLIVLRTADDLQVRRVTVLK